MINPTADITSSPPAVAAPVAEPANRRQGLDFGVARTLDEVTEAWRLVYGSYRRKKLIDPNPLQIHTSVPASGPQATVFVGRIGPLAVTTLTAIRDSTVSLPLDRVYSEELNALRAQGRQLMEVSLFADRREDLARTADALLQLMRYVWEWGRLTGVTDFVIGVHPRHARFYSKAFGFEQVSNERTYAAVNNHPVVMLRGEPAVQLKRMPLPRGLEYFSQNPVPAEEFAGRYMFPQGEMEGSVIRAFLARPAGTYVTSE